MVDYEIMKERNCYFPLFAVEEKDNPILTRCEISCYPHVLILDKKRTVIFNGSQLRVAGAVPTCRAVSHPCRGSCSPL